MQSAQEEQVRLFHVDSIVAARQPKTDRLILKKLLKDAAMDMRLEDAMRKAHAFILHWADLETRGRLSALNETQMQGDFLRDIFGQALGYVSPLDHTDNIEEWHRIQHEPIHGQTPDAVLGHFNSSGKKEVVAVIELKGSSVHLDRDRSNGRTAVDQCWDYMVNMPPGCRWGIVSNMVSFRLYERNSTKRAYEHFSLQSLRDFDTFRQFYILFHRDGLLPSPVRKVPTAVGLLRDSTQRQRQVGDELYDAYSTYRTDLIEYLYFKKQIPLNDAIEMTQRLFDRVMFIAFCEDRRLLPEQTIKKAMKVEGFHTVTNPKWQNFKHLFQFIDKGREEYGIPHYNGGLFAKHAVDDLDLPDEPWTTFFSTIGSYDFGDEVNLDVLGHLFERSITELAKLKETGLFGGSEEKTDQYARMPQSAKRKQLGIYYTPPDLTSRIVQYTIEELVTERFSALAVRLGTTAKDAAKGMVPNTSEYWRGCLAILRDLKIVDPACGSGAFLFQAYNALELRYYEVIGHLEQLGESDVKQLAKQVAEFILQGNLYGVDLSPEAVEITQLALWIRSATPEHTLANLSKNIVYGNSLVHDPKVHPAGFEWKTRFPEVFGREESGFDCVIGNPPWERIKLQEREFFSFSAPEIATATNAAKRAKLIEKLEKEEPELYASYRAAADSANALLEYCHDSGDYPLTGRGDTNLYAVFAELAYQIVAPHGRVGVLVPSGIASDKTTMHFFATLTDSNRLRRLYDFENKKVFFPEVHASFKFCVLNFGGTEATAKSAEFVFFAHSVEDLEDANRHIALSGKDIALLNPNTRTCPIFRSRRDAEITKDIYRRVPVLIDHHRKGPTANPWGIQFKTMFHQTNDASLFLEAEDLKKRAATLYGNRWAVGKDVSLPVYEAKLVQAYDHRAASIVTDETNWVRQGQTGETSSTEHRNPEFAILPRYWVQKREVSGISDWGCLAFKDVTSPTNRRTMIAAFLPMAGVVNSAPFLESSLSPRLQSCLLGNLNSFAYDFIVRQKVSNVHLNFFIVEQAATLTPDTYAKPCSWMKKEKLEDWISERVLKLTCTAEDMLPLAEACNFTSGSFQKEYGGKLNKWDESDRAELMAELDAAFFHLYGIEEEDVRYILSTFNGIHEPQDRLFPEHCSVAERILQKYKEFQG